MKRLTELSAVLIDVKRHTEEGMYLYTELFQAEIISCLQREKLSEELSIYNTENLKSDY